MLVRAWGTVPPEGMHLLAVEDPAQFTAAALDQALLRRGVKVNGAPASATATPLEPRILPPNVPSR
jgi:D-alanyl-D-alanine carboxypeptidase